MREMRFVITLALSVCFGAAAWPAGLTLESSTFTPAPGHPVTLFVRGAPSGTTFHWDLDGDGAYEQTTVEPQITFAIPAGLRVVRVQGVSGGQVLGPLVAAVVADARLGATRFVVPEGSTYLVTIVVTAKVPAIAPGFVEDIPAGFAVEVMSEGGAFWRKGEKLEAIWPLILDPDQTVVFSYRLYPLAGVFFQFSGAVSAYVEGKRMEVPIAGMIRP